MKLIKNARIITMDAQRRVFDDGAVAIAGSRIEAVGERQALERRCPEAETIDAGGMLLIPGLINAHTTSTRSFTRAWATMRRFPAG